MSKRIDYAKASPEGYKALGGVHVYLQKSGLPAALIDLVYLRVSQINGCAFCIDMHSRDLLKSGLAVHKLVLVPVWRDAGEGFRSDLVYLRVSQINGCAFCIDMHSRDLLKSGLAVHKLVLVPVWRDAGEVFSARERCALAWTETVTLVAETGVPEADYEAATSAFSNKELAD